MRIISDYKDYYDSAQMYGQDPTLVYSRRRETFTREWRRGQWIDAANTVPPAHHDTVKSLIDHLFTLPRMLVHLVNKAAEPLPLPLTLKLVGFCGFLHPAIGVDKQTFYAPDKMLTGISDDCLDAIHINRRTLTESLNFAPKGFVPGLRRMKPLTHESWQLKTQPIIGKRVDDLFIQFNCPTFVIVRIPIDDFAFRVECTLNPVLKVEQFQKLRGPAETFQEISMYLGNQLAPKPDPISRISDDIMRDQKGFDQWSFRRHKSESKKNKKKA